MSFHLAAAKPGVNARSALPGASGRVSTNSFRAKPACLGLAYNKFCDSPLEGGITRIPAARARRPRTTTFCPSARHVEFNLTPSERRGGSGAQPPKSSVWSKPLVTQSDFLVIGSGIAGLSYALAVADHGSVAIVTKSEAQESNTKYAQGGVCAVLDANDSIESHIADTIVAGAYLCDEMAVDVVCREGPARVLELAAMGAEFTKDKDGTLHLAREGGHTHHRIVHAADVTGREIERTLIERAREHPNITFFEQHLAVDLVTADVAGAPRCIGVDVLNKESNAVRRFIALTTMIAAGGAGHVYPNTTNPTIATGDGVAMAYRAFADIENMEFVQFHPTSLYTPPEAREEGDNTSFLISEAVRGAGGRLYNMRGERFMERYDSRGELAPRDIVARAIDSELKAHGDPHVWLDVSHEDKDETLAHFPNIAEHCRGLGIDITRDPIPVVPAAHYMCGGIKTGLNGETSLPGLFACGEATSTGLHGANRLASNSLLEALVFAHRAVRPSLLAAEQGSQDAVAAMCAAAGVRYHHAVAEPNARRVAGARELRSEVQRIMWEGCGIVRSMENLEAALTRLAGMRDMVERQIARHGISEDTAELRNLLASGELIVRSAMMRKESRGLHYCVDYAETCESERRPTVVRAPLKLARRVPSKVTVATKKAGKAKGAAEPGSILIDSTSGSKKGAAERPREVRAAAMPDRAAEVSPSKMRPPPPAGPGQSL